MINSYDLKVELRDVLNQKYYVSNNRSYVTSESWREKTIIEIIDRYYRLVVFGMIKYLIHYSDTLVNVNGSESVIDLYNKVKTYCNDVLGISDVKDVVPLPVHSGVLVDFNNIREIISRNKENDTIISVRNLFSFQNEIYNKIYDIIHSDLSDIVRQKALEEFYYNVSLNWFDISASAGDNVYGLYASILKHVYHKCKVELVNMSKPYLSNDFKYFEVMLAARSKLVKINFDGIILFYLIFIGFDDCLNIIFYNLVRVLKGTKDTTHVKDRIGKGLISIAKKRWVNIRKIVLESKEPIDDILESLEAEGDNDEICSYINGNLEVLTFLRDMLDKGFSLEEIEKKLFLDFAYDEHQLSILIGDNVCHLLVELDILTNVAFHKYAEMENVSMYMFKEEKLREIASKNISFINYPMLCIPNEPSADFYNPFLTDSFINYSGNDRLIPKKWNQLENSKNIGSLIESVSKANRVPFTINKTILNILTKEFFKGSPSNLFEGENILLSYPENPKGTLEFVSSDPALRKKLNAKYKEDFRSVSSHNDKYYNNLQILTTASLFVDTVFYLPVFCDFRGRYYPISASFNYQKGDLARSLLLFANPDAPVLNEDGELIVRNYLANLQGLSKKSLSAKQKWVKDHLNDLILKYNTSNEVFLNDILTKADEPFQFLSCFLEYLKYLDKNNDPAVWRVPVIFDATCSGFQHLAGLMANITLAEKVNVVDMDNTTPYDKKEPSDYYAEVLTIINKALRKGKHATKHEDFTNVFKQLSFDRSFVKLSIMTTIYNITILGIRDQLISKLKPVLVSNSIVYEFPKQYSLNNKSLTLSKTGLTVLAKLIFDCATKGVTEIDTVKNNINAWVTVFKYVKLTRIYWDSPVGLKVVYGPAKIDTHKTKTSLFFNANPVSISVPTNNVDYRELRRGIFPNFIHSLDAAHLHLIIKLFDKNQPFYCVHDCIATHPNLYKTTSDYVTLVFCQIYYNKPYLARLQHTFLSQILEVADVEVSPNLDEAFKENENVEIKFPSKRKPFIIPALPAELSDPDHLKLMKTNVSHLGFERNYGK